MSGAGEAVVSDDFDPFGDPPAPLPEVEKPAVPAGMAPLAPAAPTPAEPEKKGKGKKSEKKDEKPTPHVDEKPPTPTANALTTVLPAAQVARPTLFGFLKEHLAILAKLDNLSVEEEKAGDAKVLESVWAEIAKLGEDLAKTSEGLEKKIVGWANWITGMDLDSETLEKMIKRYSRRKAMLEGAHKAARSTLQAVMDTTGMTKVTAPEMTVWTQDSPESLEIANVDFIPVKFFKQPEELASRLDKKALLDAIKGGMAIPPGVTVKKGRHVRIKV